MADVLVLTDAPELANAMRRVLRREGITVKGFDYGQFQSCSAVVQPSAQVVVCDAYEVLSAVAAARLLREGGFTGRIILMGWAPANSCYAVKTAMHDRIVNGFLVIPFDNGSLCRQVARLLQRSPAPRNQNP